MSAVRFERTHAVPVRFHEYANLFPMLIGEPLATLRDDIRQHGVREPIVMLGDAILDGRNRYMCARDCGIEYPVTDYQGDDPLAFVVSLNLKRRHLDESQRSAVAAKIANMKQGERTDLPAIEGKSVSQADAAALMNVSLASVERATKVMKDGAPELIAAVESGQVSVSAAADVATLPQAEQVEIVARGEKEILQAAKAIRIERGTIRRAELATVAARPVVLPDGKFGTIVIDPPWPMEKVERDARPNQVAFDYPTMNEEALRAFGGHVAACAADDCHLFMWTTHKFLPLALNLIDAWGFRYVLTMVWHKPGGFQPFGLPQYNCEFAVYARRGSPTFIDTKAFDVCFPAPRREHSRKPDEFYDVVRRVTAAGRIDIFSREPRPGFEQFGNESEKFEEVA